jgi:hypothetical protein
MDWDWTILHFSLNSASFQCSAVAEQAMSHKWRSRQGCLPREPPCDHHRIIVRFQSLQVLELLNGKLWQRSFYLHLFDLYQSLERRFVTMSGQPAVTLNAAFDKLKQTVSPADATRFQSTTLEDVWKAARDIERVQKQRQSLRNLARIKPLWMG